MNKVKVIVLIAIAGLSLSVFQNCGSDFNPEEYSNQSSLSVLPAEVAPMITSQSPNATITVGQGISFAIGSSGTNLKYQWYRNDVAINGATSPSYSIGSAAAADAGTFKVIVSNSVGSVSAQMILTVNQPPPVVPPVTAPVITSQPASGIFNLAVSGGLSAFSISWSPMNSTLSVTATNGGAPSVSYQWYYDPVDIQGQATIGESAIPGATASTYTINAYSNNVIRAVNQICGSYRVKVTNSAGSVFSSVATIVCSLNGQPYPNLQ